MVCNVHFPTGKGISLHDDIVEDNEYIDSLFQYSNPYALECFYNVHQNMSKNLS